jgi:FlaA1/EpsC-like NDP-sugar epimerase
MQPLLISSYNIFRDFIIRYRRFVVTLLHVPQVLVAYYLAFLLRFEGVLHPVYAELLISYLPHLIFIRIFFYLLFGLHKDLWRYTSTGNLLKIISSTTAGSIVFLLVVRYGYGDYSYPRSIFIIDWMLMVFISGGVRFSVRIMRESVRSYGTGRRVILIGAGDAGERLVRDMKSNPRYPNIPIGFIDDDIYKKGLSIHGMPILGTMEMVDTIVEKHQPDEFIICLPSATNEDIRRIFDALAPFNLPVNILPVLEDMLHGKVTVTQIKPISLEDLLMREQVRSDIAPVRELMNGRTVLVTGAGGSIGSELCRQIFKYRPAGLVLLDRYENGLFDLDMELSQENVSDVEFFTVIADVLDKDRLRDVFLKYRPSLVFHAAAHKHVPLMEANPLEAVKNNIFGTKNVIDISMECGVERMIQISTDKAVNPTNVMGATKRVAELLTLKANGISETTFTTVRFGNVLGSNGSVFHVFKKQIEKGGPVTVTHPEIMRFFMLIPEAVQLVLQAASYGQGGVVFVLDMGVPIRIVEFAESTIRLSGLKPYEDIDIVFTGLRPGEKMYEELFDSIEERLPTPNDKLMIASVPLPPDDLMGAFMQELEGIISDNRANTLTDAFSRVVEGYRKQA